MQRYFFDVTNGHRLADPSGMACSDDREAIGFANVIARQIAAEIDSTAGRQITVRNVEGLEIGKVSVDDQKLGRKHGSQ